ncbi:MAG TPA: transglycosylase SLT domain-containing protein [Candidatus Acidoferrales bacterium]|nr:transglycosylase SLT domain-containing protein [Candidatus Acidoferrales bacterium]
MTIDSAAVRLAGQGVAYAPQIAAAAQRHGLDPELLAAVAAQETGGPGTNAGRNVVGDGGHGHGLFQIDDRWHAFASSSAAMDPGANADYAAGMLSGLLHRYGGSVRQALSAYNAGSPAAAGTMTIWPDGRTLGYAGSVLRHYARLTGGAAPQTTPLDEADAEAPSLVAALSALPMAAGQLPPPPALGGTNQQQPQPYQPQATDYGQLFGDDDN